MKTFALSASTDVRLVSVWCEPIEEKEDGSLVFDVMNGGWRGVLSPEKTSLTFFESDDDDTPLDCAVVWEGEVPKEFAGDFNLAIPWIETQLQQGRAA